MVNVNGCSGQLSPPGFKTICKLSGKSDSKLGLCNQKFGLCNHFENSDLDYLNTFLAYFIDNQQIASPNLLSPFFQLFSDFSDHLHEHFTRPFDCFFPLVHKIPSPLRPFFLPFHKIPSPLRLLFLAFQNSLTLKVLISFFQGFPQTSPQVSFDIVHDFFTTLLCRPNLKFITHHSTPISQKTSPEYYAPTL